MGLTTITLNYCCNIYTQVDLPKYTLRFGNLPNTPLLYLDTASYSNMTPLWLAELTNQVS